ncbi:enoyl-CoA hydratase/isomerase family protein [Sinorhizobium meliloti]|uniref:enoyl-CoA hydratase/isomerase family protein n=2 Tax=Sinorhizobium/Ensifer group TaxID=227292 RepID=UPI00398D1810
MGASNAALMALTGDLVSAKKGLAWGLVSKVVPQGELMARARAIAAVIVSRAPIAAGSAKANLKAAVSMPLEKAIEYERQLQTICFATEYAADGRAAFKEKRSPVFRRR